MAQSDTDPGYKPKTSIPIDRPVRDNILKPLLMGGETYSELIVRMSEQYDPPTPEVSQ